jgi:hypothetical protein
MYQMTTMKETAVIAVMQPTLTMLLLLWNEIPCVITTL